MRVEWRKWGKAVQAFVIKHWLPLCFFVAVTIALAYPAPGRTVVHVVVLGDVHLVEAINIIIVFIISGLVLRTADIKKALGHWKGIIYGVVAILLLTPCLGFGLRALPLTPNEFASGLAVFSLVPTTLGVGEALVRSSKGNATLALLLLVGTNMLGIATMPPWVKALLSTDKSLQLSVDALDLFLKLLVTVLVPAVVGKLARDLIPLVGRFATQYKQYLGMFSTVNLAMIVWQSLSGAQEALMAQSFLDIFLVILSAVLMHAVYLFLNGLVATFILRLPLKENIAVTIMASQKSAPVAVTVISYIAKDVTQQGLLAVPCIAGQICQIFMGSAFAPFLARRVTRQEKNAAAEAAEREAAAAADVEAGASDGTGPPVLTSDPSFKTGKLSTQASSATEEAEGAAGEKAAEGESAVQLAAVGAAAAEAAGHDEQGQAPGPAAAEDVGGAPPAGAQRD